MKILSISIRQKGISFALITKSKDSLHVKKALYDSTAIMDAIKEKQVSSLAEYFKTMAEDLGASEAVVYVSMPSNDIRLDCWPTDNAPGENRNEQLKSWVDACLRKEKEEDYAIGIPLIHRRRGGLFVSGAGISASHINVLYEAMKTAELDLAAIEAEAVALIRCNWKWNSSYDLVDIEDDSVCITGFRFHKGIYSYIIPGLTASNLMENQESIEQLANEIKLHSLTGESMFEEDFPNLSIYVTGKNHREISRSIRQFLPNNVYSLEVPEWISFDKKLLEYDLSYLCIPIGLALRTLIEKRDKNANSDDDVFTNFSGNGAEIQSAEDDSEKSISLFRNIMRRLPFRRNRGDNL